MYTDSVAEPSRLGVDFGGSPNRHSFLAAAVTTGFQFLGVAAALCDRAGEWHALHPVADAVGLEFAHGRGLERGAYNDRAIERVVSSRRMVLGRHAGLRDYFVPIHRDGVVEAVLVSGPLANHRPTGAEIQARWRWLTGHAADPADPTLSRYMERRMQVLTLDPGRLRDFRRWLECIAALIAGEGDARSVAIRAASLLARLEEARFAERMWESARSMLDDRSARSWLSQQLGDDLARIRMTALPDRVLVGLIARPRRGGDPIGEILKLDLFQRACVELALATSSACGRVGDRGVVFLVSSPRPGERVKNRVAYLREHAREIGRRRFGFELHFGESPGAPNEGYAQALSAAERALSRGALLLRAQPDTLRRLSPLRELRRQLGAVTDPPRALIPRFEQFVEAAVIQGGHRIEVTRVQLETGFDQAAQALVALGMLSEKTYLDLCDALDGTARSATSVDELIAAYRRAVSNLVEFSERPVEAAQHGNVRRALQFVRDHLAERLSLSKVARVAGFAPSHFALLFKRSEKTSFGRYVKRARIERAKELLQGTDLSADRISNLVGFNLRHYFHRVFKEVVGVTPMQYRRRRPKTRRRLG
jgi:AraC-like DNA-binding protein